MSESRKWCNLSIAGDEDNENKLAVAGIAVLFVYGKNKKTWLSMLLCLTMLSGLVTTALPVEAADIHESMEVSCTIQVDGEDAEVTASITYVIYDEDDSEDEAGDVTESVESSESGSSSDATEPSEPSDSGETIETSEPSDEGGQPNEESSESTEESSESTEENSESTEESSESTEESGEPGDESTEESGDVSDSDDNSSEDEGEVIFDLTFDDLTTFEESTDYVKGGGYKGAVTLSTEFDHTTGSGQSLKMAGRTVNYHRVKILDALADAQLGETYLLSAWVYSETGAETSGDNSDVPSEDNAIFRQTFDDLDSISENVNTGGGYKISNVTLTTDLDHTTGGGQCLKLSKRTHNYDRIRILNALADAVIGETYTVSVWVYSETAVDNLYVNGYYSGYDKNATEANLFDIAANTWAKVEFQYTHTDESILHIGIEQNGAKKVTGTIYVDDVTVTEKE